MAWLVVQLAPHSRGLAVGLLAVCRFGPFTLLGLFAGVVTDRFDNRRVVIVTQSAQMVFSALLATITLLGHVQLWEVYAIAVLAGLRARLRRTVAPEPHVPDGRARRAAERDRAQLEPLQHRAHLRPGARRRPHRGGRGGLVLRDQHRQLPGGARRPAGDARVGALPAARPAHARRSGAAHARASPTRFETGRCS